MVKSQWAVLVLLVIVVVPACSSSSEVATSSASHSSPTIASSLTTDVPSVSLSTDSDVQRWSIGEPDDSLGMNRMDPSSHWDFTVTWKDGGPFGWLRYDREGSILAGEPGAAREIVEEMADPACTVEEQTVAAGFTVVVCVADESGLAATSIEGVGTFRLIVEGGSADDVIEFFDATDLPSLIPADE